VLFRSKLLQVDSPSRIYAEPNSIRIAQFIGSPKINVFPAQVNESGAVSVGGHALAGLHSDARGEHIQVAVRPEAASLADVKSEGLPCRVVYHENLGSDAYFHVELNIGGRAICRMKPSALDHIHVGDEASLVLDTQKALLFDVAGDRITRNAEVAA